MGAALYVFLDSVVRTYFEVDSIKLAFTQVFEHRDINQSLIIVICSFVSLLGYNIMIGVNDHLGQGGLIRLFFKNKIISIIAGFW